MTTDTLLEQMIDEPEDGLSAALEGSDIGCRPVPDAGGSGSSAPGSTEPEDGLGVVLASSDIGRRFADQDS